MSIKDVLIDDVNEIMKLERHIFKREAFSKEVMEELIKNNLYFLKIEKRSKFFKKTKILGIIIAIKDRSDRVNIINVLIHPEHRHQNLGSFLLSDVLKRIKNLQEIIKVVLNVRVDNEFGIKLYKKFNFRITKTIEKYYQSSIDAYLMELDLNT